MIKITSLCDNVNNHKKMWAAEGNSILIEVDETKILYDVGRYPEILQHNLACLNLSLEDIDYVILSHGHKGHCGAAHALRYPSRTTVLFGSGLFVPKFKWKPEKAKPVQNELLESALPKDAVCVQNVHEMDGGRVLVYKTPDLFSKEEKEAEKHFLLKIHDRFRPDFFEEELNVCIRTRKGLIILTGCAHRKLDNIVHTAMELTGERRIYALIGGTHIVDDRNRLQAFFALVRALNIQYVAPSHCTGFKSIAAIAKRYKKRYLEFNTGKTLQFE